jgi:hypothetical protein
MVVNMGNKSHSLDGRSRSYLDEHSRELVDEVLKKWFHPGADAMRNIRPGTYIIDQTPLELVVSIPNGRYCFQCRTESYISFCIEHSLLKYCDEAWEHLREYSNSKEWIECEMLSEHYSKGVISACRYIELDVQLAQLINCDKERGAQNCYVLDKTVDAIYREAKRYEKRGRFYTIVRKTFEDGLFKAVDSDSEFFARSLTEPPIDAFIRDVYTIAKDPSLIERMKTLRTEKEIMLNKFRKMFNNIIDDVERGHINLKGSCKCCKPWLPLSNNGASVIRRCLRLLGFDKV